MEQNTFGVAPMLNTLKWPESLCWLAPVLLGAVTEFVFFLGFVNHDVINRHREILIVLVPFCVVAPVGGWWAIYQCIRHEKHPARYVATIVLVPLGFIWYYFERYRRREAQA